MDNDEVDLDPAAWYTARQAAAYLEIQDATLKKKLREGSIIGEKRGARDIWHVRGREIIRVRKKWNLD